MLDNSKALLERNPPKALLEAVLRKKLLDLATDMYQQDTTSPMKDEATATFRSESIFQGFLTRGKNLIAVAIHLSATLKYDGESFVEETFPLLLLEEFFDYLPVFLIEQLFDWMVSQREILLKVCQVIRYY